MSNLTEREVFVTGMKLENEAGNKQDALVINMTTGLVFPTTEEIVISGTMMYTSELMGIKENKVVAKDVTKLESAMKQMFAEIADMVLEELKHKIPVEE